MTERLPEGTYIELVRSLFRTLLPTAIMALSFLVVGLLVTAQTRDTGIELLVAFGSIAALNRLCILLLYRDKAESEAFDIGCASKLEKRFALAYMSFAGIFGAFCADAVLVSSAAARTIVIGLLFGYGAGVAAGLSLRPWISIPSIALATVPTVIILWLALTVDNIVLGCLLALFLAGGVNSMLTRYRATAAEITMRRSFSMLARRDHLTGLANRLSLRERFEEFAHAAGKIDIIAVHCLDLDRFKPVNDRLGHPIGDALLKAVAERLLGALRECDFAARIGGDEFVVLQTQAKHPEEVAALARRIFETIAEPFSIEGHRIQIGTSIGYILSSEYGADIDLLVFRADKALCAVKRDGGGIAKYDASYEAVQRLQEAGSTIRLARLPEQSNRSQDSNLSHEQAAGRIC